MKHFAEKLLPQMPFGVERPCNVGEKSIGVVCAVVNTFFIARACALAGTSGTERGRHTRSLAPIFNRRTSALGSVGRAAILHNVLMQPAGGEVAAHL
ncbi:MAG: hypothetical protein ACKO96_31850 [Flammeovirgaceae bacterium]